MTPPEDSTMAALASFVAPIRKTTSDPVDSPRLKAASPGSATMIPVVEGDVRRPECNADGEAILYVHQAGPEGIRYSRAGWAEALTWAFVQATPGELEAMAEAFSAEMADTMERLTAPTLVASKPAPVVQPVKAAPVPQPVKLATAPAPVVQAGKPAKLVREAFYAYAASNLAAWKTLKDDQRYTMYANYCHAPHEHAAFLKLTAEERNKLFTDNRVAIVAQYNAYDAAVKAAPVAMAAQKPVEQAPAPVKPTTSAPTVKANADAGKTAPDMAADRTERDALVAEAKRLKVPGNVATWTIESLRKGIDAKNAKLASEPVKLPNVKLANADADQLTLALAVKLGVDLSALKAAIANVGK